MVRLDLPPLGALRMFEAVARQESFKRAAEELGVTSTAVSHQIRQLEAYLGCRVLDRSPRRVSLTGEGMALYQAAHSGFEAIANAVAPMRRRAGAAETITLSSTASFLGHWLAPRLDALRRALPSIDLRFHASDAIVDLKLGGVEAAIRYGKGPFANAVPLCSDAFAPVGSPQLRLNSLADLRVTTLLHVDGRRTPSPEPDWRRWLDAVGADDIDARTGQHFPDSFLALQAAIAGQGIALVSLVLADSAIASGLLVAPFARTLPGATYHFACADGFEGASRLASLREWLTQEFRNGRGYDPGVPGLIEPSAVASPLP